MYQYRQINPSNKTSIIVYCSQGIVYFAYETRYLSRPYAYKLTPLFYFGMLYILGTMWSGYNPISTGMSELGAVDSPFRDITNYLGFSVLGLSIVFFSFGFRSYFRKNIQFTTVFVLVLLGGIFMTFVGFLPCDPGCVDISFTGRLHSAASTVPAILIPLSAILAANLISEKWGARWGYTSFYLGLLSLTSGPIMFIPSIDPYSRLIQRIGLGLSLIWIMLISLKVYLDES